MSSNKIGSFRIDTRSLNLNTSYVKNAAMDTTGVLVSLTDIMFHELLHAYQIKKGLSLANYYPSIDELLHAQKLIEAEAAGWNKALGATVSASKNKSYFLTPEEVQELMKRDLIAEERNWWKRMGMADKFDKRRENIFKKIKPLYHFQQALIACRGNYHLAQKRMAGQEIKKLMSQENTRWAQTYNKQALGVTLFLCLEGKVSERGNPVAYQKMLDYYKKNYGLNPNEIENNYLKKVYSDKIALLKSETKRLNLYSDANHMTTAYTKWRNNGEEKLHQSVKNRVDGAR